MATQLMQAERVAPAQAGQVAQAYASVQRGAPASLKVRSVESVNDNLYLVHFSPVGYAFVSADDCATPVYAYSFEGNLSLSKMPENMAYMMNEASQAIAFKASQGVKNNTWKTVMSGGAVSRASGEPVDPLISVKWDQGSPYNKYCPGTGSNKAVVGCVAVSMSQAMSVQQSPKKPQGHAAYTSAGYGYLEIDYDKEKDYDWDAIMKGSNNYDEVARLLYHAGVSVSMDYGADGSGVPTTQLYRITNALKNNFGYLDAAYYTRDSYKGDWEQLLINDLIAGNAIVYNAIDSKGGYGHSFNLDGYDGNGLFHVNWGWGGYGNAYFSINALKDDRMGMNYDSNHSAITGISSANSPLRQIQLSDLVIEDDTPAGSPIAALFVNGDIPQSDVTITVTGEYDKYSGAYKESSFTYKDGVLYTSRAFSASEEHVYVRVVAKVSVSGKAVQMTQGFNMTITAPQPIENRTLLSYERDTKLFVVRAKYGTSYTVKNSQGAVVATGKIEQLPAFYFNRSDLTPGINTIEVVNGSKSKVIEIKL